MSAWTGWTTNHCGCLHFKWGCKERPKTFNWCHVHFSCKSEDTDPVTGCTRPRYKFSGCAVCNPKPDMSPQDQSVH